MSKKNITTEAGLGWTSKNVILAFSRICGLYIRVKVFKIGVHHLPECAGKFSFVRSKKEHDNNTASETAEVQEQGHFRWGPQQRIPTNLG